ncbi:glycosyltransferase [Terriglobus albidus]|uniref:Glycosyltransferase n=1 Tax=Terriglobus albidus TaxID=1592106 RepID=A0A5B9EAL0_9BACT|nr:glycosyltransferase [Terriglobus albidus]QEE27297.1 glycosyltransferase [Terriglobus albidus]
MYKPRIFYFSYRHNSPTGGQKHTYRHVDILSRNGFSAFVFHPGPEFRLTWFQNETPVITESEFYSLVDPDRDVVVLPEDLGTAITCYPGRKVIFNKNLFLGFRALGLPDVPMYPYSAPDVVAAFVVSEHNFSHIQFAFPRLHVERVYLEVNTDIFRFNPLSQKKPRIAFVAKDIDGLLTCYHMTKARTMAGLNSGAAFEWIEIREKTETETAAILKEALIFLFLSCSEGMGRMPLEAMASGCLLASYGCGPLHETVPPYAAFSPGDIVPLVTHIEKIMSSYGTSLDVWQNAVMQGLKVVQDYRPERQERALLQSWHRILNTLGR